MKTLYQKFAGWLCVGPRHYWPPIVWALVSFLCLCQPVFADVEGHRMIPPVLIAGLVDTVGFWLIAIVIICAIIAVAYIGMRKFGVQPPDWVVQIFWILVVCVVVVMAIGFLVSLAGGQPGMWLRGPR